MAAKFYDLEDWQYKFFGEGLFVYRASRVSGDLKLEHADCLGIA